jgi:hypothetical protein
MSDYLFIYFLSISFKFILFVFFIRIVVFQKIIFFNILEKRDVEREIIGENFGKRKIWKRNSTRK